MIRYNPKEWFVSVLNFHKADTFRKLAPMMIIIGLYSFVVAVVFLELLGFADNSSLKNFFALHTIIGFALSMLLVFRTNTAYERWWEGRKLWGSLVNATRSLAIKLNAMLPSDLREDRTYLTIMIGNYADSLKSHLRGQKTSKTLEEGAGFTTLELKQTAHQPNAILSKIFARINNLYQLGRITGEQYLILNTEITTLADVCGGCERIKNTPIPFSYSSFLKKFIFFYVVTLPLGYVISLHYLIIPLSIFILYVLGSLELIAEEIEDPFGYDANDLPTDALAKSIRENTKILMQ